VDWRDVRRKTANEIVYRHLDAIPTKSTIHAVLDRHGLVERRGRVRRRAQGTELSLGKHS
jgi:hypothetical protein